MSACVVPPPQPAPVIRTGAELENADWVAVHIAGVASVAEPVPRLRWTSAEQLSGSGGCNAFVGRAVVNQGALTIDRLAATKRLCAAMVGGGQEDLFFKALETARVVRLVEGQLLLEDGAGRLLSRFSRQ